MNRLQVAAVGSLLSLCIPAAVPATYLPQERIPTDSPVYRDLERLATSYGVAPRFLSSRPLRRAEALAFLRGLAEARARAADDPAFQRAARYLDPDATGATRPLISAAGEEDERLEISPYALSLYSDDPRNNPDVNRDYRVGASAAGSLDSSSIFVIDLYEGTASQGGRGTPNFGSFNSLIEGVNFNSYLREAYVEFPISRIRILFGRSWIRWGPGEGGTLALSDAAPALDMLRAEAGMFRRLRYTQFVSMLDPGPETYLAGHRLEWAASGKLYVGFTELARFNGTSQAPLYMIPFAPYSYWEKRPKTGQLSTSDSTGVLLRKNNVLWATDISWIVTSGWRVHGEFLLDDFSFSRDYKPDMIGYQAGLRWRRAVGTHAVAGNVEYSRVNNFVYSVWHGHDFSYDGFPTGFELGPDIQALSGEISYEWGPNWRFQIRGEWRRRGEGSVGDPWLPSEGKVDASSFQGVVEREVRAGGSVIYSPARWFEIRTAVSTSDYQNLHHVQSGASDRTSILLELALRL